MENTKFVRQFKWKDISQIMQIEHESFENDKWDEIEFMKWYELFPKGFLVAENEIRDIIGYVICDKEKYIRSIAVKKSERRKGFGKMLIHEVIKIIDANELYIHVRVSNKEAIKFYETLGFQILQKFNGIYENGEDAIYMKLQLKKK